MSIMEQLVNEMQNIIKNDCKGWTSMKDEVPDPAKYPYVKVWKRDFMPPATEFKYCKDRNMWTSKYLSTPDISGYHFWKPVYYDLPNKQMINKYYEN